jgi:hypothetical protein
MMKKRLTAALALVLVLMAFGYAAGISAANFGGTWIMDKSKSEGLMGAQANAQSVTWIVSQDDKQITVDSKVVGADGQSVPSQPLTYKLDGNTTSAEVQMMGSPMKATLKAKWMADGKILELDREQSGNIGGNDVTVTFAEHWELTDDGRALKVHRVVDSPRGKQEQKLVFARK